MPSFSIAIRVAFFLLDTAQLKEKFDVLNRVTPRVQPHGLKDEAFVLSRALHLFSINHHLPRSRSLEARDYPEQCALSTSRGPDDAHEFSLGYAEVDIFEHVQEYGFGLPERPLARLDSERESASIRLVFRT